MRTKLTVQRNVGGEVSSSKSQSKPLIDFEAQMRLAQMNKMRAVEQLQKSQREVGKFVLLLFKIV
jgi:hypothetical protein